MIRSEPSASRVDAPEARVYKVGQLYQLIREVGEVRERTFEITFQALGAQAFSFTFG